MSDVPNAYSYEHDTYRIREPTRVAAELIESQRLHPISETPQETSFLYSTRTMILYRRWVHVPGRGEGAVWADENNRTRGPICFAGQRTTNAPEALPEPASGW